MHVSWEEEGRGAKVREWRERVRRGWVSKRGGGRDKKRTIIHGSRKGDRQVIASFDCYAQSYPYSHAFQKMQFYA